MYSYLYINVPFEYYNSSLYYVFVLLFVKTILIQLLSVLVLVRC